MHKPPWGVQSVFVHTSRSSRAPPESLEMVCEPDTVAFSENLQEGMFDQTCFLQYGLFLTENLLEERVMGLRKIHYPID